MEKRKIIISNLQEYIGFLDSQEEIGNFFYFRGEERDFGETKNTASGFRWMKENKVSYGFGEPVAREFYELLKIRKNYFKEIGYQLNRYEVHNFVSYCQHHGLPTELLDITENPLVALYFACQGENIGYVYCFDKVLFQNLPLEYSLSNNSIEKQVFDLLGFGINKGEQRRLIEGIKRIRKVKENSIVKITHTSLKKEMVNELEKLGITPKSTDIDNICEIFFENTMKMDADIIPYFIHRPSVNFDRMVNQQGLFIVQQLIGYELSQKIIPTITVEIPGDRKKKILKQLDNIGINQKFIYPDADNIAKYISQRVTNRSPLENSFYK